MRSLIPWRAAGRAILLAAALFLAPGGGGTAAVRDRMKLYVTNSLGDDITVTDLATLKPAGDIRVGKDVHGACAPADGRRLFTTIESTRKRGVRWRA